MLLAPEIQDEPGTTGALDELSSDADGARADFYALVATLLLAPPDAALLEGLKQLGTPDAFALPQSALEDALNKLASAAQAFDAAAAREEFDALFTGMGTPLINPYGSLYLGGFMNDVPLAALRDDLQRLGLARRRGIPETEDHLGALCETMRVLIEGVPAAPGRPAFEAQPLAVQQAFFTRHIAGWYARVLDDIARAEPANFYAVAAGLIRTFLDLEAEAFALFPAEADATPAEDASSH